MGSFISDALRQELKVDFAFINRRGIRVRSLEQGNITLKDIYQMDPFQNDVMVFRMTGSEITSLIRYSYGLKNMIDLAVSGMTYTVTADANGNFMSVEMKDTEGNPIDPGKEYTLAMNSYAASAYRFDHRDPGQSKGITSEEVLVNYLQNIKEINYSGVTRTFIKQ
jgi:5'-nucleotidase / UDP-sugar diphosphatase